MTNDATLDEMWRIKEELSAPQLSWEEYAAALYAYQAEERKRGVKFVSFSHETSCNLEHPSGLFVAEDSPVYDTHAQI